MVTLLPAVCLTPAIQQSFTRVTVMVAMVCFS